MRRANTPPSASTRSRAASGSRSGSRSLLAVLGLFPRRRRRVGFRVDGDGDHDLWRLCARGEPGRDPPPPPSSPSSPSSPPSPPRSKNRSTPRRRASAFSLARSATRASSLARASARPSPRRARDRDLDRWLRALGGGEGSSELGNLGAVSSSSACVALVHRRAIRHAFACEAKKSTARVASTADVASDTHVTTAVRPFPPRELAKPRSWNRGGACARVPARLAALSSARSPKPRITFPRVKSDLM